MRDMWTDISGLRFTFASLLFNNNKSPKNRLSIKIVSGCWGIGTVSPCLMRGRQQTW